MRSLQDHQEEKRVGLWIRVSTEEQAKGESPEHHEYRGRAYAEIKGWAVIEVYHLEGQSGRSVLGHPETERMMRDIRSGRISGLIFSKLARLGRNTRELLDFAEFFRAHDADLISLQEAIDTSTPAGRYFYTNLAAGAQFEREEIADRVAASVPVRAALGKPLGGAAPFGYRWENRKLVPDPEEAPVRRLMYELFLEVRRVKTVARLLNERGFRTRQGSFFTHTTVERLLRDPIAKGERRANYTRSLGKGKRWQVKPEKDWITTNVEPVVSLELWDEVNRILDERRRPAKQAGPRPIYLFTGLVFCACGTKMAVPSNTPKWVCKKCRNKIPLADLERTFERRLQDFLVSPEEIARESTASDDALASKRELLASLTRDKERAESEMEKVYRLYVNDRLSAEGFDQRYRPLEERVRSLAEELPRLQAEIDFLELQHLTREPAIGEARDLYSKWGSLSFEDRRAIVETILERVTVEAEEVIFDFAPYLPSSLEIVVERSHIPAPAVTWGTPATTADVRCPWSSATAAASRVRCWIGSTCTWRCRR